ncbi:hypothetical protein [Marinobacter salarius]|uniref:hypothetical protein n=1 Tax=Marinobacter salarius TaxID=1420917 RepID=UPI003BABACCE
MHLIKNLAEFLRSRVILHSVYLGLSFCAGYIVYGSVSLVELRVVIGTLQNVSAAVFTLSGIWIAYSYPQAIAAYTSPSSVKVLPNDETKRIENLVLIVLTSALVISSILIFNMLYLVISESDIYKNNRLWFKLCGASFVIYLAFLQLKAISVVMVTNISFVNELHHKKTERSANQDL